jgi:hypothetical protein
LGPRAALHNSSVGNAPGPHLEHASLTGGIFGNDIRRECVELRPKFDTGACTGEQIANGEFAERLTELSGLQQAGPKLGPRDGWQISESRFQPIAGCHLVRRCSEA